MHNGRIDLDAYDLILVPENKTKVVFVLDFEVIAHCEYRSEPHK